MRPIFADGQQAQVLAAQGDPTSIGGYTVSCACYPWYFGTSLVAFDWGGPNDIVTGWSSSGGNLVTSSGPDGTVLAIGATKAQVLAAQGDPT